MVKVNKGGGPWLAKQKPIWNWQKSQPGWSTCIREIDWPMSCLSYLTQGGAPLRYPMPKQVWWLMGHKHQETGNLTL